ncbi:MAG: helix-turn-helix domain-containing protein [Natronomonas sp.]
MNGDNKTAEAVEVLRELGLKEYEAQCFVGLTHLPKGTAKELSEITDVPRTRVYDAVRTLESQGLVEIQHSNPQQFRAVPLEEATETLRDRYEDRVDRLSTILRDVDRQESEADRTVQEVWAMSGTEGIANRSRQLIADADEEVVLVLGDGSLLTEALVDTMNDRGGGVDLFVGTVSEPLQTRVEAAVPDAETFVSGLEWLQAEEGDEVAIGRLMLVDRSAILVSSIVPEGGEQHAIFGDGFRNGLVVISRRLMAQGLFSGDASVDG